MCYIFVEVLRVTIYFRISPLPLNRFGFNALGRSESTATLALIYNLCLCILEITEPTFILDMQDMVGWLLQLGGPDSLPRDKAGDANILWKPPQHTKPGQPCSSTSPIAADES